MELRLSPSVLYWPFWISPLFTSLLEPNNRHSTFLMNLSTLGTSYTWNYMIFVLLWLAYFTLHNVIKFHLCCSMGQNLLPFKGCIIVVFRYHNWFIHSSISGHLGFFHLLVIVNNAAMNTGLQISQIPAISCFGLHMQKRNAGSYANFIF
jgi:hypothetical protein